MFSIINTNYHRSFATCRDHTRIHLLAGKQCCQAQNSAAEANESVDARRLYEFAGCGIDDGIDKDHPRAPGEVIRPLTVIAAHRAPMAAPRLQDSKTPARRRLARFGHKGIGAISRHFLPAIVPILARSGQKRSRIGANGYMVYRMGVPC